MSEYTHHLGDCSIYQAGSRICDCGYLRAMAASGEELNNAALTQWTDHQCAIDAQANQQPTAQQRKPPPCPFCGADVETANLPEFDGLSGRCSNLCEGGENWVSLRGWNTRAAGKEEA